MIKAAPVFRRDPKPPGRTWLAKISTDFMLIYKMASPEDQKKLEAMWKDAGLGDLPNAGGVV